MFLMTTPARPPGSVRDLPSFRELEQQLSALKLLTYFIGRRYRHKLIESERQMERLATTVDNFYAGISILDVPAEPPIPGISILDVPAEPPIHPKPSAWTDLLLRPTGHAL